MDGRREGPVVVAAQAAVFVWAVLLLAAGGQAVATVANDSPSIGNKQRDLLQKRRGGTGKDSQRAVAGVAPIIQAAMTGSLADLRDAMENGSDPDVSDAFGRTALWHAASNGRSMAVQLLLDSGARTEVADVHGNTPLLQAALRGQVAAAIVLLGGGAAVNAVNAQGLTPLLIAAQRGNREMLELLIGEGADMGAAKRRSGQTALWSAAFLGHDEIVGFLITAGADVDAPENDMATPLYAATQEGKAGVAEMLLGKGADPNARTLIGATPLHIAAATCNLDLTRLLLSSPGIDVRAEDDKGRTSGDVACLEPQNGEAERETLLAVLREAEEGEAGVSTPLSSAPALALQESTTTTPAQGPEPESATSVPRSTPGIAPLIADPPKVDEPATDRTITGDPAAGNTSTVDPATSITLRKVVDDTTAESNDDLTSSGKPPKKSDSISSSGAAVAVTIVAVAFLATLADQARRFYHLRKGSAKPSTSFRDFQFRNGGMGDYPSPPTTGKGSNVSTRSITVVVRELSADSVMDSQDSAHSMQVEPAWCPPVAYGSGRVLSPTALSSDSPHGSSRGSRGSGGSPHPSQHSSRGPYGRALSQAGTSPHSSHHSSSSCSSPLSFGSDFRRQVQVAQIFPGTPEEPPYATPQQMHHGLGSTSSGSSDSASHFPLGGSKGLTESSWGGNSSGWWMPVGSWNGMEPVNKSIGIDAVPASTSICMNSGSPSFSNGSTSPRPKRRACEVDDLWVREDGSEGRGQGLFERGFEFGGGSEVENT